MQRRRIDILVHAADDFSASRYLLRLLAGHWLREGFEIRMVRGTKAPPDADVAILHTDLTRVPDAYLEVARRYRLVINGRVTDIAKRRFSDLLLERGDDYAGPVMVKTDANFGGLREHRLRQQRDAERAQEGPRRWPWASVERLDPDAYPVFDSIEAVPEGVWANPRLVVERFLPERHQGLYCLRTWTFLGDREICRLSRSPSPVVKSFNAVHREPLEGVPEALRRRRAELGFDYGKFDFGIVDGRVVLYDVNRTPTVGPKMPAATAEAIGATLAAGIHGLLG